VVLSAQNFPAIAWARKQNPQVTDWMENSDILLNFYSLKKRKGLYIHIFKTIENNNILKKQQF